MVAITLLFFSVLALNNAASTTPPATPPATQAPTAKNHHHHHTHTTKEPNESESFQFKYDHTSHKIVAKLGNHHDCYVYALSTQEQTDVHTSHGLRSIEFKIMHMVENMVMNMQTTTPGPEVTTKHHSHHTHSTLQHLCHGSKHIYSLD